MHKHCDVSDSYFSSFTSFFSSGRAESPKPESKMYSVDEPRQALYNCLTEIVSEQSFIQGSPMCAVEINAVKEQAKECAPCASRKTHFK
jgi:hypothetical protein